MPKGVAREFLDIVDDDYQVARYRLIVLSILAAVLFAPAYFLAPPWGAAAHGGAILVGWLAGFLWGTRRTGAYENSLRASWNDWMRLAFACESIPEMHRKVASKRVRGQAIRFALILLVVWATEVALLAAALAGEGDLFLSLPAVAANGLLFGAMWGYWMRAHVWSKALRRSVQEMVSEGEIGVWGVV